MKVSKVSIVVACHIQPSDEWVSALEAEAKKTKSTVIIVHDSWKHSNLKFPRSWKVFNYAAQESYLGEKLYKLFTKFHRSSSCKNFGLLYSYREGFDYVIVIDSDCVVRPDFVELHVNFLNAKGDGWINPITETNLYSRGFPYSQRMQDKWCHMGLWDNELDLYGKDRLDKDGKDRQDIPKEYLPRFAYNPAPGFFPLSGMNLSFKHESLPYMLFLPNFVFNHQKFIRHDDIWGGYIFQKIAKMKNKCLSFGLPVVYHDTIVDATADAKEEEPMYKYEDAFIQFVDEALDTRVSPLPLFERLRLLCHNGMFDDLNDAFQFQLEAYKHTYGNHF